jgi:hypothetical protein
VRRVRRLSRPRVDLSPLVDRVAGEYRAWVRAGRAELAARRQGPRAAAAAAAAASYGGPDRRFRALWAGQTALEDQLAPSQRLTAGAQDHTFDAAQALACAPP